MMDGLAKEYLVSFYSKNLMLHGDRPEALRWSPVGQRMRYRVMLDIVPELNGKKVLDYGCGKGDLLGFLKEEGIDAEYAGVDINPDLIALAGKKHPEAVFRVADIEEDTFTDERFDLVFVCGVFNNRVEGVEDSMKNVLVKLFDRTEEALALNALSSHSDYKGAELNYTSPEELADFVSKNLTPHFVLRQDYLPGDFTIFLYREVPGGSA